MHEPNDLHFLEKHLIFYDEYYNYGMVSNV